MCKEHQWSVKLVFGKDNIINIPLFWLVNQWQKASEREGMKYQYQEEGKREHHYRHTGIKKLRKECYLSYAH